MRVASMFMPAPGRTTFTMTSPITSASVVTTSKYTSDTGRGRRDLLAATEALPSFDRPVLVAWASEDRIMPVEHGRRLAETFPNSRLVEIADSYTLVPEDQPAILAAHIRDFVEEDSPRREPASAS